MKLIEALAHRSPNVITVIKTPHCDFEVGRQFRWRSGTIQTRVNKDAYWHRTINLRTWWLESLEIDDKELLGTDPIIEKYLKGQL